MTVKKMLATAGALTMIASAAVVGFTASPAQAAGQTVTVTPNTNLKGGQVVTVTYSGFSPGAPIAVGVCPKGRKVTGPGDCGRTKNGNSKLTTADGSGKGTAQITIPQGALGNAKAPAASCPPCVMGAASIANAAEAGEVELSYAGTSAPKPSVKPSTKPGGGNGGTLPITGPRETAIMALIAFGLLQIGVVLAVRSNRAVPRRNAH